MPDDLPPIPSRLRRIPRKLIILTCVVSVPLLLIWWVIPGQVERVTYSEPKELILDPEQMAKIEQLIMAHSQWEVIDKAVPEEDQRKSLIWRQDINGDGKLDMISCPRSVEVTLTNPGGETVYHLRRHHPSGESALGFDDIDRDGIMDAWIVDPSDTRTQILWGYTPHPFETAQDLHLEYLSVKGAFYDVDGDGDLDHVLKDYDEKFWWIQLEPKR